MARISVILCRLGIMGRERPEVHTELRRTLPRAGVITTIYNLVSQVLVARNSQAFDALVRLGRLDLLETVSLLLIRWYFGDALAASRTLNSLYHRRGVARDTLL